jgi:YcaO-like protein with predicted kinase domain
MTLERKEKKKSIRRENKKVLWTHKCKDPKETVKNAKDFLKKIGMEDVYYERKIKNNNFSTYMGRIFCKKNEKEVFQFSGKGISSDLCCASAYAEAIERILPRFTTMNQFARKSHRKKDNKEKISLEKFVENFVFLNKPNKEDNEKFEWVEALLFPDNKVFKIPISFIDETFMTNGLATGNSIEEAIVQAFCEIFERYSKKEYVTKKKIAKEVNKKTIKNEIIKNFIELFQSLNIDTKIIDMTIENKVPVMGVLFTDNNIKDECEIIKKTYYKTLSVGSHIDLEEAIIRCFTEQIQGHPYIPRVRGKLWFSKYPIDILKDFYTRNERIKIINILKQTKYLTSITISDTLTDYNYLEKSSLIPFSSLKSNKNKNILDDLEAIKEILLNNKWEGMIIDYSDRSCKLNVVRAVIPSVSDQLGLVFPNKKKFKDIDEMLQVFRKVRDDVFHKNNELLDEQSYYSLKYDFLPKSVLPWGRNHHPLSEIIRAMDKKTGKNKKIKIIIKKIYLFNNIFPLFDCTIYYIIQFLGGEFKKFDKNLNKFLLSNQKKRIDENYLLDFIDIYINNSEKKHFIKEMFKFEEEINCLNREKEVCSYNVFFDHDVYEAKQKKISFENIRKNPTMVTFSLDSFGKKTIQKAKKLTIN